jgi:transcriptional regulator with XRE-family HTH domain
MKRLTQDKFLGLIRDDADAEGTQKALAAKLDVSEAHLSDVLRGRRAAAIDSVPLQSARRDKLWAYRGTGEKKK